MTEANDVVIDFRRVSYRTRDQKTLLTNLELEVRRGETLVLLGRSGSGKTTTLKLINRLIDPSEGELQVEGAPPLIGIPFACVGTSATSSRKWDSSLTSRWSATWDWCRASRVGRRSASGREWTNYSASWGSTRSGSASGTRASSREASGSASAWRGRSARSPHSAYG